MNSPLDFSAELSQQLKQAAAKMKAMRAPLTDAGGTPAGMTDDTGTDAAPNECLPAAADAAPFSGDTTVHAPAAQTTPAAAETAATAPAKATTPPATAADASAQERGTLAARNDTPSAYTPQPLPRGNDAPDAEAVKCVTASGTATATAHTPTSDAENYSLIPKHSATRPPLQQPMVTAQLSQTVINPTLSTAVWAGGVKGTVLAALRSLARGENTVQVNLKRLAVSTGIPYGSVRNAMSRLVQTGDIASQQIRMADGHGVRVTFLTAQGREGTAAAALGTPSRTSAPATARRDSASVQEPPASTRVHSFWRTKDSVFAVAWPFAAAAGLTMTQLRDLQEVYEAQGFTAESLPQSLRAFDAYAERQPVADYPRLAADFLRALQRKGCWSAPDASL